MDTNLLLKYFAAVYCYLSTLNRSKGTEYFCLLWEHSILSSLQFCSIAGIILHSFFPVFLFISVAIFVGLILWIAFPKDIVEECTEALTEVDRKKGEYAYIIFYIVSACMPWQRLLVCIKR